MIKRPPSKEQLRTLIERETECFLKKGESIQQIPRGMSSRDEASAPLKPSSWQMPRQAQERTYLPEVVETLEQRRAKDKRSDKHGKTAPHKTRKPRKRLIYDDFGEPLRWVWVDD